MHRADMMGSALDPLLPLNRWIQYTQAELQTLRSDCSYHFEQVTSTRRSQQQQLDSDQTQIRVVAQQQSQLALGEITEIANTVTDLCGQTQKLQTMLNTLAQDVLQHFSSQQQATLLATQLAAMQPDLP